MHVTMMTGYKACSQLPDIQLMLCLTQDGFAWVAFRRGLALFQVACMVRIEVEKAQRLMFQVTVGSSDVNTSAALKDLICQLLARI